jgi:hypothetical protein
MPTKQKAKRMPAAEPPPQFKNTKSAADVGEFDVEDYTNETDPQRKKAMFESGAVSPSYLDTILLGSGAQALRGIGSKVLPAVGGALSRMLSKPEAKVEVIQAEKPAELPFESSQISYIPEPRVKNIEVPPVPEQAFYANKTKKHHEAILDRVLKHNEMVKKQKEIAKLEKKTKTGNEIGEKFSDKLIKLREKKKPQ